MCSCSLSKRRRRRRRRRSGLKKFAKMSPADYTADRPTGVPAGKVALHGQSGGQEEGCVASGADRRAKYVTHPLSLSPDPGYVLQASKQTQLQPLFTAPSPLSPGS